jgi:hypothetical protein
MQNFVVNAHDVSSHERRRPVLDSMAGPSAREKAGGSGFCSHVSVNL